MMELSRAFIGTLSLDRCLKAENQWHQGTDTFAPSIEQVGMMGLLSAQGSICLKNWRWSSLPSTYPKLTALVNWSPFIIGVATESVSKEKYPVIHFVGKTISYNIGKCIKVAYAIVTLSTIFYNPALFAMSTMGWFSSYLIDSPKISSDVRQTAGKIIIILNLVSLIIYSPSNFTKAALLIELVLKSLGFGNIPKKISDLLFHQFSVELEKEDTKTSLKTIGKTKTSVNPKHLKYSLPKCNLDLDKIDTGKLQESIDGFRSDIDKIQFSKFEGFIEKSLEEDDYFQNGEYQKNLKAGWEFDFVKEGARIFLYRLETAYVKIMGSYRQENEFLTPTLEARKNRINDLEINEKEDLAYLLNWLQDVYKKTEGMSDEEVQEKRALFLINIGVHGANYCRARLADLPSKLRNFSNLTNPKDLKSSLFYLLRDKQENFIRMISKEYLDAIRFLFRPIGLEGIAATLCGDETPHGFNKLLYLFGQPIGLNCDLALADRTISPLEIDFERVIQFPIIRHINPLFYNDFYTESEIINWVREAINNNRINSVKFIEWLEQQEDYSFELVADDDSNITNDAIRYFLLKHGVLGVVKEN